MKEDLLILIAGAILGFLSAFLIELSKNRLENKRWKLERTLESKEEKEKSLREFLSVSESKKISPAWLTLIKTGGHSPSLFQKDQTEDAVSIDLPEKLAQVNSVLATKSTLEKFLLVQTQIIGRQDDCEIRLSDSSVSRLHAMIRYEEGYFVVYDLASKSGSYVNGIRVDKNGIALQPGDQLRAGDSVFIFDGYSSADKGSVEDRRKDALITKPPRSFKSKNKKSSNGKWME